jgi:NADPH2:quinone reductase
MRAVVVRDWGRPEDASVEEVPKPSPGPGEVLVEARALGVNYPDLLVIAGAYQVKPPLPFTPGKELAGVVAAVGEGVTAWKPGDRVIGQVEYGAWGEFAVVGAEQCFAIPDGMPFEQAASMGIVYQTAWFASMDRGQFTPGDVVLVTGATGGVGLAALHLVKALGGVALAAVSGPEKAEAARAAGADHVIDLAAGTLRDNLRDGLRDQVRAATGGHGCDICIDPVGGDVFDAAMRALAWRGRMVVVGFASGRIPEIKANYLLVKNIAVAGIQWSDYRDNTPDAMIDAQARMFELWREGKLRVTVMDAFPLDRFADALAVIRERRVIGKVVLST